MQRTLIVDALASAQPQASLTVCGWIRTRRDAKGFCFVELNDGSCLANLQCIVDEGTPAHAALGDASTGASLAVTGELVPSPGKGQAWELRAAEIRVFGTAPNKVPVVSFSIDGVHPNDIAVMLDASGIAIRTGHHCAEPLMNTLGLQGTSRASLAFYNTIEEVDYFTKTLDHAVSILR